MAWLQNLGLDLNPPWAASLSCCFIDRSNSLYLQRERHDAELSE